MRKKCGFEWPGGLTREWNTGKRLLQQIAQSIKLDASKDLGIKGLSLKDFLDNESNMFLNLVSMIRHVIFATRRVAYDLFFCIIHKKFCLSVCLSVCLCVCMCV